MNYGLSYRKAFFCILYSYLLRSCLKLFEEFSLKPKVDYCDADKVLATQE
jgi:hypothetical protein